MTETRFPSSGLSAEYGDIIISGVTSNVIVSADYLGSIILSETYYPDNENTIKIKDFGTIAMVYFNSAEFLLNSGIYSTPVVLSVSISSGSETITKTITIYPSNVDFSESLSVDAIKQIPLSRATKKNTAAGRIEFISFYGGTTVKIYAVYMGESKDIGSYANLIEIADPNKIYSVNVSPDIVATLFNISVDKLIYYNVYTSDDYVIRYIVSKRYQQFEKTFIFRNCFGAQETFTCTGDETEQRKWTRDFANVNSKKIDISRFLENSIKINTGYLSDQEVLVVEDLLFSDKICMLFENKYLDVTILDEDFNISSRKDEVKSVNFSYRVSNQKVVKNYIPFKKPKIFTPEFSHPPFS